MQSKKRLFNKVILPSLLITIIIGFSNCKKEGSESLTPLDNIEAISDTNAISAVGKGITGLTRIDVSTGKKDSGFAYRVPIDPSITSDSGNQPSASILKVYENGVEIGPAHSLHDDIRNVGKGRFSHWTGYLYFSASDNSNPLTNGRKYTYSVTGNTSITTPDNTAPTNPGSSDASQLILGYATVNGSTTGGQGGSTVTVSSLSALKSALEGDNNPKIVYISGAIKGAGVDPIYVKSNKSIIGLSGASVEGASFQLLGSGVSNVIIQNLKMSNYITYGGVTISEGAHHVWIDHCEFSVDRDHGYDYYSKDVIVARGSDYVTISWNKFHDQVLSVLISSGINSKSEGTDVGRLHVTLHHNFWYNISEREPTMNYGSVHMFNNYHLNNNGYSVGARAGGNVRTDNDYFSNCKMPISTDLAGDPPGYITGANTNVYVNCEANNITTPAGNWAPNYEYKAALNAAQDVPAIVTKGAGPR